jgi:hypothetical protein
MLETEESSDSLVHQLRRAIKDGVDYFGSVLALVQARAVEVFLSGAVFLALLAVGGVLAFAGVVLLVVALGIWLTHLTGSAALACVILGGVVFVVAAIALWRAMAWLGNLKS